VSADRELALAARVQKRMTRILGMKDGPARDRLLRAIRAGLMVGEERGGVVHDALTIAGTARWKLSGLWFPTTFPPPIREETSRRLLEEEPDGIALEVATAAKGLLQVLSAIAAELDAVGACRKAVRS
jgi:hypothetical protein